MTKSDSKNHADDVVCFVTDAESESVLNSVLSEIAVPKFAVKRGGIDTTVEYLSAHSSPRLLVVDISKSELPLSDINALADACEPGVEVIVVGQQNDIGLFRDLIQLGISDYIAKPLTRELLRRSIETVRRGQKNIAVKGRVGKLVAVTGTRGGVGASTITANLAWILSQKVGRRVAMVDLDFNYGPLSIAFDQKPTPGLREAIENAHRVDQLFLERTLQQIDSRLALLSCEEALDSKIRLETDAYENLTEHLSKLFHYVLVDLPCKSGAAEMHVLRMASVRIITIDPTLSAVRHAIRILKLLGAEEIDKQTLIVLNRRWQPTNSDLSIEEIEKALGHRVDVVVPFGKSNVVAAENSGQIAAEQASPMTDALMDLAQELSGRPKPKQSFWEKLLGGRRNPLAGSEEPSDWAEEPPKAVEPKIEKADTPEKPEKPEKKAKRIPDDDEPSFDSTFG